jgi:tRNA 5-methylaminomethyl-2-thiouridine biosynthesis bifunctional protein
MSGSFTVEYANIEWREANVPYSKDFEDSYYSLAGGLDESQYVYIQQNQILERCKSQSLLKVAEIGFGSGLNFLLTWKAWLEAGNTQCQLDYIAFEKFPLHRQDFERALSSWPELKSISRQLLDQYPIMVPGFIRIPFEQGKIHLTLIIGDALKSIQELSTHYHVWYLDGFSPQKNPLLWSEELCLNIRRLSMTGASFSTFTAAGSVRRTFLDLGFEVVKFDGFASKRESLKGVLLRSENLADILPPWKASPKANATQGRDVTIIGGGIAGFGVAHALCKRNFDVTILEASNEGFAGASGNRSGIFTPYIARSASHLTDLLLPSFLFSLNTINQIESELGSRILNQCGAIQILHTDRLRQLFDELPELGLDPQLVHKDRYQGKDILNLPLAGWLRASQLCEAITSKWLTNLSVRKGIQAISLNTLPSGWSIKTAAGLDLHTSSVIICSAQQSSRFSQTKWLPLEPIRGELLSASATSESNLLEKILMGKGYILPADEGVHIIGADYAHNRIDLESDPEVQLRLLNQAKILLPELEGSHVMSSRASFRTSTHHRLPYIGPVVKEESYLKIFADLKKGYAADHYSMPEYYPGLYVSAGHGSRGLISSLAAGELIADLMTGTTPLFKNSLCAELNPTSFLTRQILR